MGIIEYIGNHWVEILAVFGSLNAAAVGISKMTKNKKDDEIVAKIGKFLDFLAVR